MSQAVAEGRVHHERHDRILKIVIDNPAKKNSFTPDMMLQLSEAMTLLDRDPDLWVGVLCAVGSDFTARLDMRSSSVRPRRQDPAPPKTSIRSV